MPELTVAAEDLLEGDLELHGRVMPASNATFIGTLGELTVVYKPISGERPLWDFPDGTLAAREVAAYAVSEVLGWHVVPPTVLRDGPHGPGMVQAWMEPDPDQTAVDIVSTRRLPEGFLHVFDGVDERDRPVSLVHEDSPELLRMAVFDVLVNNADRKGGHVLAMDDGHRYGVDHGVSFHVENKLRTVLWGWLGKPLAEDHLDGVARVLAQVRDGVLPELLDDDELDALERRCHRLLAEPVMPAPHSHGPAIPWPPF